MLILRWHAFAIAFASVYILTRPAVDIQWFGWSLSTVSCLLWFIVARKDKDLPRSLMELMYLLMGFWGIYNWYGY
tara:strand:+ start:364 stop:588 length:225 start_codon:yes stop_codon:yes gene_type:complete